MVYLNLRVHVLYLRWGGDWDPDYEKLADMSLQEAATRWSKVVNYIDW